MKKARAFTLIELLIVIAIIAILATIIIVSFSNSQIKARDSVRKSDFNQYAKAVNLYVLDGNIVPSSSGWINNDDTDTLWPLVTAGYLGSLPLDPKYPTTGNKRYMYYKKSQSYTIDGCVTGNISAIKFAFYTGLELPTSTDEATFVDSYDICFRDSTSYLMDYRMGN